MANFRELRKNLKKDSSGFSRLNLAVLADQASPYIAQALRAVAYEHQIDAHIYEGAFDRMLEEALDADSGLYRSDPDQILVFPSAQNYRVRFYNEESEARAAFAEKEVDRVCSVLDALAERSGAPVMLCNFCATDDGLYGNFAGTYPASLLFSLRRANRLLAEAVAARDAVFLVDVDLIQSTVGAENAYDPRMYYLVSCPWTMDFLSDVAGRVWTVSDALRGKVRKCLVTDLDDTLWGGAVGDIGVEHIAIGESGAGKAHADLQTWIRELSRRGVAVCVCSKNDEKVAKEPFLIHPDMILRLDDIAVFIANWRNKSANIEEIQRVLNIGFDSMVFIDDNPFERGEVRGALPGVIVPELPEDATLVPSYLQSLGLFETIGVSTEDADRTEMYRQEAERERRRKSAVDLDAYLKSLDMRCAVRPLDNFSIPRAAQLTQRTNQFNLRTQRYTEKAIADMAASDSSITLCASLRDAFGDYGIIGVVILQADVKKSLFLDTFLMSCRVAKRGVESFLFNAMVGAAACGGYEEIRAEYLPTAKNGPVRDLLKEMGFAYVGEVAGGTGTVWRVRVGDYTPLDTFVREASE